MEQSSEYDAAKKLYKEKAKPSSVKDKMNEYLNIRIDDIPVGIDEKGIYILAKNELRSRHYKEAENLLKICLKLNPQNINACLLLGKFYAIRPGKEKEAEDLFNRCLNVDSKNITARVELGKLYLKQNEEQKAEQLINECLEILGNDKTATDELARQIAIINQYKNDNSNLNFN